MQIRTMIAEDEPLARARLAELIRAEEDLVLVAEAEDGDEAARLLDETKPDLLFIDVRMPGRSGISVLESATYRPTVVFTTAYDHYALAAFELAAVDYLLKPFGPDRFRAALDRARTALALPVHVAPRLREMDDGRPLTRIFVRDRAAIRPVAIADIVRLEAKDDYVATHVGDRSFLLNVRLQLLEARLDPDQFVRIHRSHIINLDHVRAIHAHDAARMIVEMSDGASIVASRSGSARLRKLAL
ncbi:MAG TPA: LytTR family DNA-binding domain-containing protein [Longimicrobiales bacterium]|nr:LytTR family DNA-binding domain-containing protein [Longimicrobiales bacterium]